MPRPRSLGRAREKLRPAQPPHGSDRTPGATQKRQEKTQARSQAGGARSRGQRSPLRDFVGPRLSRSQDVGQRAQVPDQRESAFFFSPFLLLKQALKQFELKSTGHKRGGEGPETLSELEVNIIFTTSQLATEWISTFLSFASERSSRNLVAIFPLGTGSLNGLLLPPNPNPHLTSEKSFNNRKS